MVYYVIEVMRSKQMPEVEWHGDRDTENRQAYGKLRIHIHLSLYFIVNSFQYFELTLPNKFYEILNKLI